MMEATVEVIKGADVNVPDAVFAWILDGKGGAKPLENTDEIDEAHPCWLQYSCKRKMTS